MVSWLQEKAKIFPLVNVVTIIREEINFASLILITVKKNVAKGIVPIIDKIIDFLKDEDSVIHITDIVILYQKGNLVDSVVELN